MKNRDIKFRLLEVDGKIIGYCAHCDGSSNGTPMDGKWNYSDDGEAWHGEYIPHDTIEQFTGSKDFNGDEIYEGDTVTQACKGGKVFWCEIEMAWMVDDEQPEMFSMYSNSSLPMCIVEAPDGTGK